MVTRSMLNDFLTESIPKILNEFSNPSILSDSFAQKTRKLSETLFKTSLALSPDTVASILISSFYPTPAHLLTPFLENLFLYLFKSRPIKLSIGFEFCSLFKNTKECAEKPLKQALSPVLLPEGQELSAGQLKGLLDDLSSLLQDAKEDGLDENKESFKKLSSLKSNLASLSTTASLTRRATESQNPSNEGSFSLDISDINEDLLKTPELEPNQLYFKSKSAKESRITDKKIAEKLKHFGKLNETFSDLILNSLKAEIESFQSLVIQSLNLKIEKLNNLNVQITNLKSQENGSENLKKLLKKALSDREELQEKLQNLNTEKKKLETRLAKNARNLENELKSKSSEIATKVELTQELELKIESVNSKNLHLSGKIEELLIKNLDLQEEISILERKNIRSRKTSSLASKEENSANNPDSSRFSKASDLLETSKKSSKEKADLKESLKSLVEKHEKEKESLVKDLEECRQNMEVQILRLRQEKSYQESICRDLQSCLREANSEKEGLEAEVYCLKKAVQGFNSQAFKEEDKGFTVEIDSSKSSEVPEKSNTRIIQQTILEELNEIHVKLSEQNNGDLSVLAVFEIVKNCLAHIMKIQEALEYEAGSLYRETSKNLSDVVSKLKMKVKNIEKESSILNKRAGHIEFDYVYTEPHGTEKENFAVLQYYKKQLQIEKAKVLEKKHVNKLHKEQIDFLKQSLREIQREMGKIKLADFEYLKEVFTAFIKEVPILNNRLESLVELICKVFCLSAEEQSRISSQRALKRSRKYLKQLFHGN